MSEKPFSQACENNKDPILRVLREELADVQSVLELGSGTGQHACYFAAGLPGIIWQPTDLVGNHSAINAWSAEYRGDNLLPVLELDVRWPQWGVRVPQAVFSANSLHIMAWSAVAALFEHLGQHAPAANRLCIYGPFNYQGAYTSDSNARFDQWLAQQDPASAIRDFEAVDARARAAGYRLHADHAMPANNRLLVWHKLSAATNSA